MKKIVTLAVIILTIGSAQAQSNWNIGLETGGVTNIAKFESGNEEANALFSNNPYQYGMFGINFRYKINNKFSVQSGLNFTELGFNYGMAKNYSLLKPESRNSDINTSTGVVSVPALFILNTPVNCSNVRFIFGAGISVRAINNKWDTENEAEIPANEGANAKTTYMTAESRTVNGVSPAVTWKMGIEKMLSKGNSFSFTFQGTQGFSTIAESTVNYTAGNQEYSHTFINRGSFATMAVAYNFSSFGTSKANKLLKNSAK